MMCPTARRFTDRTAWQDMGHSHWHDSLIWGVGLSNLSFTGGGTINGGGMTSGDPPPGGGDKTLALQSCSHVSVTYLTLTVTGHFALLATNVEYLLFSDVVVRPTRDGLDIVSCRHVLIERVDISGGGDDAVVLKSDFSLGRVIDVYNVTVQDSRISTDSTTALEIGSETVGDFYDIQWRNIVVESSGDAGIGIATMDGARVHHVTYDNITMTGCASPFAFYIGSRLLRPRSTSTGPGAIHDITVSNVRATRMWDPYKNRNWTALIDGQPHDGNASHNATGGPYPVGPNIVFQSVQLTFKGGGAAADAALDPPHQWNHWFLADVVRPAWALWLRGAVGVVLADLEVSFERGDQRPALVVEAAHNVTLQRLAAGRGGRVGYDVGVRPGCTGVRVLDSPGIVVRNMTAGAPPIRRGRRE